MSKTEGNGPSALDAASLAAENARLKAELESARASALKSKRRMPWRSIVAGILVLLTALSVVSATLGVWTKRTLANPDRYVSLVSSLAKDPAVTDALAVKLTDQVFIALNIQQRVQDALVSIPNLPPAAGFLAGPIVASAQNVVLNQVKTFLASDTFANLWTDVNRQVYVKLQALLNGDYSQLPNVSINGGEVQLNMVSVIASIIQQVAQHTVDALGINVTIPSIPATLDSSKAIGLLGSALGVSLPPDFGQITIMTADQLSSYQSSLREAKRLVALDVALALLLIVGTILVFPNRRRAVVVLGASVAGALFLAGVGMRQLRNVLLNSITGPGAKAAATDIFTKVGTSLRHAGMLVFVVALVAAIAAYLAGRPKWLRVSIAWAQRMTADRPEGSELEVWVAKRADQVRVVGVAVAAFVLFLTGIDWLSVVVVGVLVGLLIWRVGVSEERSAA